MFVVRVSYCVCILLGVRISFVSMFYSEFVFPFCMWFFLVPVSFVRLFYSSKCIFCVCELFAVLFTFMFVKVRVFLWLRVVLSSCLLFVWEELVVWVAIVYVYCLEFMSPLRLWVFRSSCLLCVYELFGVRVSFASASS